MVPANSLSELAETNYAKPEAADTAPSNAAEGLQGMLRDIGIGHGFSGGLYVRLGHQSNSSQKGPAPRFLIAFGAMLAAQYVGRGYFALDPFAARIADSFLPLHWTLTELERTSPHSGPLLRAFERCGGMTGIMVPVQDHASGPAFVNLFGRHAPNNSATRDASLLLAAYHLHAEAGTVLPAAVSSGTALTDREIKVLRLAALGWTEQETAQQLLLSRRGVQFHLSRAIEKLDAPNKTAAVARAVSAGLIRI